MCDSPADPRQVAVAVPRPAPGSAVDPIALEPVDEVVITTLVDNVFDGLLTDDEHTTRAPLASGLAEAPQFETGLSPDAMVTNASRLGTDLSQIQPVRPGRRPHLSGPAFEPIIARTVDALTGVNPDLLAPGHCTGWRAQHALAAALPGAWVAGSSGSSFRLAA